MAETINWQKLKLVKMLEILRQETDEQHALTTKQLCERMEKAGIPCNRKVLYKDIALLNKNGFEIMSKHQSHDKAYYVDDRSFSIPELKILIDAVQAASFVTEKKTTDLINKIAALGGSHQAEILKDNLVCFNTRKHTNESIYYAVEAIETAILRKNKISFFYFDLNEYGDHVYRKDKQRYLEEPLALIFNTDNYYLLCYSNEHKDKKTTFRLDRMDHVEVEEDPIFSEAKEAFAASSFDEYTEQAFTMFSGALRNITIQFEDTLINIIFDKFGEDTKMIRTGEHTLVADVPVQVSSMFFGWLCQFEGKVKVLSPQDVIEDYKIHIEENIKIYE